MLQAVEALGGRLLFSYRPFAIVVTLPRADIVRLRRWPGIVAVDLGPIPVDQTQVLPDVVRLAILAWNERLAGKPAAQESPSQDLPWDAPGHLPPDRPPERRRSS